MGSAVVTPQDPIELAIDAAFNAAWPGLPIPAGEARRRTEAAIRAAAPGLIQHGRELAADSICRHGSPSNDAGYAQWDRDMRLAEGVTE